MRPVDAPGVTIADFDSETPGLGFDRKEAVWAIGGKWEQQFMGVEAGHETLLPGVWLRSAKRWDFKGWDGWQVPDPLRRCHGCHTVGLDADTGVFVEPNIGCESCHGPGEWHVETHGLGRIFDGNDVQVCGQCHTRGQTKSGEYFFPVSYRPGGDLDAGFAHDKPSLGQNSTFWYGNGRERKRHQEYTAWKSGGHSQSLENLRRGYDGRFGEVSSDCLGCHSADYIRATGPKPPFESARSGITCNVCHNVHGQLDELRLGCDGCHIDGAYYHLPSRNASHVACPPEADTGCTDCHMPKSVKIGGVFALHDHSPGVIAPSETQSWGTPSSCSQGGCHASQTPQALQELFEVYYPTGSHIDLIPAGVR